MERAPSLVLDCIREEPGVTETGLRSILRDRDARDSGALYELLRSDAVVCFQWGKAIHFFDRAARDVEFPIWAKGVIEEDQGLREVSKLIDLAFRKGGGKPTRRADFVRARKYRRSEKWARARLHDLRRLGALSYSSRKSEPGVMMTLTRPSLANAEANAAKALFLKRRSDSIDRALARAKGWSVPPSR